MKKTLTKLAQTRLRRRRAKLDVHIARAKRAIKSLERKLRMSRRTLSKRQARRAKLK